MAKPKLSHQLEGLIRKNPANAVLKAWQQAYQERG
jgi:hypothetical protein